MFRYRLLAVLAITVATVVSVFGHTVQAAGTGSNITTSPVSVDLPAKPGTTVTTTMQVQNNSAQPVKINLHLQKFKAGGTNGQAQIFAPEPNDQSIGWVSFSQSSFVAQPGVWTPVTMTVKLPENAALGYYYAVQFKPDTGTTILQKGTNAVAGSNVVLVLVNARSANAVQKLQVTEFSSAHKVYEYLPTSFSITAKNTGTIYFPPHGDIYISRSSNFTSSIATIPVNSSGGNILPDSSRTFQSAWKDGFPAYQDKVVDGKPVLDDKGQPVKQLRWNFGDVSKLRFGKYYAKLALVYNDGQRDVPVYSTVSFWVIPWKLLLVGLILLLLILGGMFGLGRFVYRRVPKKSRRN